MNKECEVIKPNCIVAPCCTNICDNLLEHMKDKHDIKRKYENPILHMKSELHPSYEKHFKQNNTCPYCGHDEVTYYVECHTFISINLECTWCHTKYIFNEDLWLYSFHLYGTTAGRSMYNEDNPIPILENLKIVLDKFIKLSKNKKDFYKEYPILVSSEDGRGWVILEDLESYEYIGMNRNK